MARKSAIRRAAGLTNGGGGPFAGFTRLSSLIGSMSAGQALTNGAGSKLLVDVNMTDGQRIGMFGNSATGTVRFDPTISTRLLCDGIVNYGDFQIGSLAVRHPKPLKIDVCGPRPTTNGFSSAERTALGIGSGLVLGPTHSGNTSLGNDGNKNDMVSTPLGLVSGAMRGVINMAGGIFKVYGQVGALPRRLNANYTSGTTLVLDAAVTCKAGDEIWVTPSGFYNASQRTEKRIVAADVNNSTVVTITVALGYARWGQLQYRTDAGISLTPDAWTLMNFTLAGSGAGATYTNSGGTKPRSDSRQEIDERSWVIIRNRNVQISAHDVAGYSTDLAVNEFGVHTMSMGVDSYFELNHVQVNDYGQLGLLGRYGAHAHMNAFDIPTGNVQRNPITGLTDGTFADRQFRIEGCTFGDGHNRALNMHGARNTQVYDNATYRSKGHSYFEEDGSEIPDTQRNVCIGATDPYPMHLKSHETGGTVAGLWFSSQAGIRKDSWAVDCADMGWVNAFPYGLFADYNTALLAYQASPTTTGGCLGLSSKVIGVWPYWGRVGGVWDGNSAMSCGSRGGFARAVPRNNAGDLDYETKFMTTTDGFPCAQYGSPTQLPTLVKNARHFKNGSRGNSAPQGGGGYFNSPAFADYDGWVTADNYGTHFEGRSDQGFSHNHILVRESLNHEGHYLASAKVCGFATYHGQLLFYNLAAHGFSSGMPQIVVEHYDLLEKTSLIESWESYTQPLHSYSIDQPAWAMQACSGVWQTPPHSLTNFVSTYDPYTGIVNPGPKYTNFGGTPNTQFRWNLGTQYDHFGLQGRGPTTAAVPYTHIVFNQPFWTAESILANAVALEENPQSLRTTTPMVGIFHEMPAHNFGDVKASKWERVDSSKNVISGASIQLETSDPNFEFFPPMKHGNFPMGSRVRITRPGITTPPWHHLNMFHVGPNINPNTSLSDHVDFSVSWDEGTTLSGVTYNGVAYPSVANWAALQASSVACYWHDSANAEVWVRWKPITTFAGNGWYAGTVIVGTEL